MNVLTRIKSLPWPAKIGLGLAALGLLCVAGYLAYQWGGAGAAIGGAGGVGAILAALGLAKRRPPKSLAETAVDLARDAERRAAEDAAAATADAETAARLDLERSARALEEEAEATAADRDLGATLRALGRERRDPED